MHAGTFDHHTRLASTGSRRDCLRVLGGALFAAVLNRPNASASQLEGSVVLGSPCSSSEECQPASGPAPVPTTCADNGFTSDGPLNCCSDYSDPCYSDAD